MTDHDDFDRALAGWFEADALTPAPAGGLDRLLDATRRRRPRPGWLASPGSYWVRGGQPGGSSAGVRAVPRLGPRWSTVLILLLVVAALVGGALLVGAHLVQPSPLPTGRLGHLAYGLDGSIYVANWDGGNPVRIADGTPDPGGGGPAACGSLWGEGPMWSPDGRHLAYRSAWDSSCREATGEGKVYIPVAAFPGTGWLVSWSPDSTRVATSIDLGHTFGIYGLDGVRQALLLVPPGYQVQGDYSPVWSPDGMSLLMPIAPIAPDGPSEIWELPIDGGTPRRVPADDPRSLRAAYSPGERHVAYSISDSTTESLIVAAADGSQPRVMISEVIPGWVDSPTWSPTGDRLALVWRSNIWQDQAGNPMPGTSELRVVDVASGTVKSLATASATFSLQVIAFSPEGDKILFSRTETNNVMSLWSVHVDGSDPQLLVSGTEWGDWQWQPAGP
jgi:Tol biopolymer transport system component